MVGICDSIDVGKAQVESSSGDVGQMNFLYR